MKKLLLLCIFSLQAPLFAGQMFSCCSKEEDVEPTIKPSLVKTSLESLDLAIPKSYYTPSDCKSYYIDLGNKRKKRLILPDHFTIKAVRISPEYCIACIIQDTQTKEYDLLFYDRATVLESKRLSPNKYLSLKNAVSCKKFLIAGTKPILFRFVPNPQQNASMLQLIAKYHGQKNGFAYNIPLKRQLKWAYPDNSERLP